MTFKVAAERTGWRDLALSQRHRLWGWNLPAVDLDFPMLEYCFARPCGLVEYKNEHAAPIKPNHPTFRAMTEWCNLAKLPFFVTRYASNFSWWKPTPLNDYAIKFCRQQEILSEKEWVALLYRIRNLAYDTGLLWKGFSA